MQSCRFRAIDTAGGKHYFNIADVPVRITETTFVLANVPDSPILMLESVVRMLDHMDVGEGDVVLFRRQEYVATYNHGFQFTNNNGTVFPSNQVDACEVLSVGTQTMSPIRLKSPNNAFRLPAILGIYEGKIITAHDPVPCSPEDLQVSAGFVYQRQKVYYGDIIDGEPLVMWHGRPAIKTPDGYIEIPTHFYLGKE